MRRGYYLCVVILTMVSTTFAERTISSADYRDRLEGMWVGQMLGNYAGRQVEGKTTVYYEGPNPVNKPITEYQVQWNTILQGQYYADYDNNDEDEYAQLLGNPNQWKGDDDTCLEFLYAHALRNQSSLDVTARTNLWKDNIHSEGKGLYIANKQAWFQINDHGKTADDSGSVQYNMHAGWAIDSQITTESLGAISVGMRQQAADLAANFGGITNEGYSLHAAQFYAAMYADAPFASNVATLVNNGLAVVPRGSWTREIVEEVQGMYQVDVLKPDWQDKDERDQYWLARRDEIIDFAHEKILGTPSWVESAANTGLTTLAILYGQGNFVDTVEYGVRGGKDSDCNPATAGGLIGMMKGQSGILADVTTAGYGDSVNLPQYYDDGDTIINIEGETPTLGWSMTEVVNILHTAGLQQIADAPGGVIPDAGTEGDAPNPGDVSDPTTGPAGLIGSILALGGTVDVTVWRNEQLINNNPDYYRTDQGRLIDGVTNLTNNGVLPFDTYVSGAESQSDEYRFEFDREVFFSKLVLYEGDIRYSNVNGDPYAYEPRGGYFDEDEILVVEVFQDGQWVEVTNLALSEALENLKYFQTIELTFDWIEGEAIRVRGTPGGVYAYTSFTEIEVYGAVPEPASAILCAIGGILATPRRRSSQRR